MSGAVTPTDPTTTADNNTRSVSTSSAERRGGGEEIDTVQAAAQVVAEHLPAGFTAEFHHAGNNNSTGPEQSTATSSTRGSTLGKNAKGRPLASSSSSTSYGATAQQQQGGEEEVESSLKLQGGDIHRELFRIAAEAQAHGAHRRANTFHTPRDLELQRQAEEGNVGPGLTVQDQLAPGGFRRAYILQQKQKNNFLSARLPITRNFVEFLDLYGSFAGEDLVDSDEEAISDGEEEDEQDEARWERRPLLRERTSLSVARRSADAGTTKTFFTLLKAFVGTGIMFLPKAFNNGGLLFSSVAMVVVSAITMVAFHLLLQLKTKYAGGYGEIGHAVAGARMRNLILGSIALSQLGFVCAGIVFVAENLMTFLEAVTQGNSPLSTAGLIALQLVVLVPLAWIRNISKLGPTALLADACILVGVTYIYWFDISTLFERGGIHKTVMMFNPDKYTMMIGSAIFTFEGIGLILPIQASMAQPEHFEWLLAVVMLIITVVFTSVGALCYATFGSETQIEIINNFPQDSKLVNAIQFLYSVAILVGTPVQLFPALRILETKIFGHKSGKKSLKTKWIKNGFRFGIAVFCGVVSVLGAGNLDKFVALIGSSACVPLVYVYPAWLHYKGVATTTGQKVGDLAMVVLGLVCMVYTTTVTIVNSFM
ncbi:transmembrane amino acid transporter protein-domain-containing protein [Podospora australis]|uniref:Transmembrane amino acid transporter protein-domain-containing protein n=1 Tax=Podospora australis TaxID=1536484 RepID=A0AAN6WRB5_9PEZI|nr:transmembrane amino acid transporter protein-domain-containing protein [Podospora australis]